MIAKFYFDSYPPAEGEVKHKPAATGDCWIILNKYANGRETYIQNFAYMTVMDEPQEPKS